MNIAIIPARGKSKGIPLKNIIKIAGKPLIAWSIEQARKSKIVDGVYVSTEDKKISFVAKKYKAEIIKRPLDLSGDFVSSELVLLHSLKVIERKGIKVDNIIFLQATSPIRESKDIDMAFEKYLKDKADSLFSAVKIKDHFIWGIKNGKLRSITYDYKKRKPRQLIKDKFLENGSIYIFKPWVLKENINRLGGKISVYEMPFWKSYQIDKIEDIEICEHYLRSKIKK